MVYALTPNSMHMKERKMREEWYPQRRRTPSFSSTLLDTIYRSIDESKSNLDEDPQLGLFKETTTHTPKQSNLSHTHSAEKSGNNKEKMNLRRAVMIEDWNWMETQTSQPHTSHQFVNSITSTSSSESSTSRAVFSSSETDTTHKPKPRPKSVRNNNNNSEQQKPKREGNGGGGGFARTKLRALKIYGELNQKVKQPLSPGSRIASFLSSLFNTAGSVKKTKMCYVGAVEDVSFNHQNKSNKSPPCSRRSCMSSKTPSSSSSSSSAKAKRTVRFYPVSVILGEDHISHSQLPSGHVYTYENDPSLLPLPSVRRMTKDQVKKKNCAGVAKENGFMKGYQNSCKGGGNGNQFGFRGFYDNGDEDDALSCSSSDLFELDHLVGAAGRYQEELPVYETTNLETNKAIANGLRL